MIGAFFSYEFCNSIYVKTFYVSSYFVLDDQRFNEISPQKNELIYANLIYNIFFPRNERPGVAGTTKIFKVHFFFLINEMRQE